MTTPSSYVPGAGEGPVTVYTGTYPATVVNNNDPLGVGRLQLNIPMVLANAVSTWAVPVGTYYTIPDIGTALPAVFLGGDPTQPAWHTGPLDLAPVVLAAAPPSVTYSASEPPDPRVNDVWFELSGGVQLAPQVWTFHPGTSTFSWVTQDGIGSAAVNGPSIIAGVINGSTITGTTINGGTFNGTDWIENSSGSFFYSGTPAAGNLISSTAAASGTDAFGNAYLSGVVTYTLTSGIGFASQQTSAGNNTYYSSSGLAGPWVLGGTSVSNSNTIVIYPSGDTTGTIDTLNLLSGTQYQLISAAPGKFYIKSQIPLAKNSWLMGSGLATVFITVAAINSVFYFSDLECGIANFQVYGGTNTTASNPAMGVSLVQIAAGAIRCSIIDIDVNYVNGYILNASPTGPMHLRIRGLRGTNNSGGILIGAGSTQAAQVTIEDVDLQALQASPALSLQNVTDVAVGKFNAAVAYNGNCVQILGSCQSVFLSEMDCAGGGTGSGQPVLVIDQVGSSNPSEISIVNSCFQQGGVGVAVNNSASRLRFVSVMSKGNGSDGWQWNGTGAFNVMVGCGGNTNNALAGVAYDVNVTSTVHVLNQGFQYVSGAVTDGRFLAAGNHYTEANPPSSMTSAGAVPGGW